MNPMTEINGTAPIPPASGSDPAAATIGTTGVIAASDRTRPPAPPLPDGIVLAIDALLDAVGRALGDEAARVHQAVAEEARAAQRDLDRLTDEMTRRLAASDERAAQAEETVARLTGECERLTGETDRLRAAVAALTEERDAAQAALAAATAETAELGETCSRLTAERDRLAAERDRLAADGRTTTAAARLAEDLERLADRLGDGAPTPASRPTRRVRRNRPLDPA